jgi:hypothetical protein
MPRPRRGTSTPRTPRQSFEDAFAFVSLPADVGVGTGTITTELSEAPPLPAADPADVITDSQRSVIDTLEIVVDANDNNAAPGATEQHDDDTVRALQHLQFIPRRYISLSEMGGAT